MHPLAKKDHQHVWHPFTQMQDWCKEEPIVIMSGKGAELEDQHGRRYLDANASIWTNLHGSYLIGLVLLFAWILIKYIES